MLIKKGNIMSSISKIAKNVNQYAIKETYKLRNYSEACVKGIRIHDNKIMETNIIQGEHSPLTIDYRNIPRDILIYNNPNQANKTKFGNVSLNFIYSSLVESLNPLLSPTLQKHDFKLLPTQKFIISNPEGFDAIDFTTAKKGVTKDAMLEFLSDATEDLLIKTHKKSMAPKELMKLEEQKIKKFLNDTGATYSKVKWSDYKH